LSFGRREADSNEVIQPCALGSHRHVYPSDRCLQWRPGCQYRFAGLVRDTTGILEAIHPLRGSSIYAIHIYCSIRLRSVLTLPLPRRPNAVAVGDALYENCAFSDCFHNAGVLPAPSIASASPAPNLRDIAPSHDFDALNQEPKRMQHTVNHLQHLMERNGVTELYVFPCCWLAHLSDIFLASSRPGRDLRLRPLLPSINPLLRLASPPYPKWSTTKYRCLFVTQHPSRLAQRRQTGNKSGSESPAMPRSHLQLRQKQSSRGRVLQPPKTNKRMRRTRRGLRLYCRPRVSSSAQVL
jgi:hypothetical protein